MLRCCRSRWSTSRGGRVIGRGDGTTERTTAVEGGSSFKLAYVVIPYLVFLAVSITSSHQPSTSLRQRYSSINLVPSNLHFYRYHLIFNFSTSVRLAPATASALDRKQHLLLTSLLKLVFTTPLQAIIYEVPASLVTSVLATGFKQS